MIYEKRPGEVFQWKSEGQPVIIMESTALQDARGVEIYEGDIVSVHLDLLFGEVEKRAVVEWCDLFKAWCLNFMSDGCGLMLTNDQVLEDTIQVIGHIWEKKYAHL